MVQRGGDGIRRHRTMMQVAEQLYGPYRWGRYDILVLPPSFPFGGMENPRLTFATPTVIVGDKSLVVAGRARARAQLVGQPGHQRQLEGHLVERGLHHLRRGPDHRALYGDELAEMERQIDQEELAREIRTGEIAPADQVLALPALTGRDPDEALSDIAYTKGAWFLQFLEQRFGRGGIRSVPARLVRQPCVQERDVGRVRRLPAAHSCSAKIPGRRVGGRTRRLAAPAGHPAVRRTRALARLRHRRCGAHRAGGRRHAAAGGDHGRMDARRSGRTSSMACRRR